MMDLVVAIMVGLTGALGVLVGVAISRRGDDKVDVDIEEIEKDLNVILPKRTSKKVRDELISYILYLLYKGDED